MTCQECELALAGEERGEERSLVADGRVEAHMAGCSACREFAIELRENSEALVALGMESMPALSTVPFHATPRRQQVAWWAGVAAVLALGFISSWAILRSRSSSPPVLLGPSARVVVPAGAQAAPAGAWQATRSPGPLKAVAAPIRRRVGSLPRPASEPRILQVKMLTDDPDVVIYWQIEN